jgi:hypothetical protein
VGVLVTFKHFAEKWAAGSQDDAVGLNLLVLFTHQGHIGEVCLPPQITEGTDNVLLEIIPLQAELLWGRGHPEANMVLRKLIRRK